jgi:ubiquinol-cytochrome c reductase iron-sulfur subunit
MSDEVKDTPTDEQLAQMSREELVQLGGKIDGVETVIKENRWPVPGTKAEKRAERAVAYWLLLGGLSGLALLVIFLFWPWEYKGGETEGHVWYDLATPLYGLTFGLSILAIGIGAVLFQKKFIPQEISIQERHDGSSAEIHRKTVAANLTDALEGSTLKRRKLIGLSLGIGLGAFGLGTLIAFIGGLNPPIQG